MTPPVVIGATGGSGTRVVARLVESCGTFIGTMRNVSEDAMPFVEFYDRWINRFAARDEPPLSGGEIATMDAAFAACLSEHRSTLPDPRQRWGWKEPRSIYLLPFFHRHFPGMWFIHVVRDGRDMAFSSNQNQLRKHGPAVLDESCATLAPAVRSAVLWNQINLDAAAYGEAKLGARYLRIRFEDLCANPAEILEKIRAFLGASAVAANASLEVRTPDSIGRWQTSGDQDLRDAVQRQALPGLRRFGYVS